MAVKGKGKQVAAKPPRASDASGSGKRRKGPGDAGPSSSSAAAKRRRRSGVIQFFDDDACVADEYEEEEEPESEDDLDDVEAGELLRCCHSITRKKIHTPHLTMVKYRPHLHHSR